MALIFWIIMSTLRNSQLKAENHLTSNFLKREHHKNVDQNRQKIYQDLLNFGTNNLSSNSFDEKAFNDLQGKITLMGSPESQKISTQLGEALKANNRPEIKSLLQDLAEQIKSER